MFLIMNMLFSLLGVSTSCSKEDQKKDKAEKAWIVTQDIAKMQPQKLNVTDPISTSLQKSVEKETSLKEPKTVESDILPELPDNGHFPIDPFVTAGTGIPERPIVKDIMKKSEGKIQVIEFFNYPCPGCANLDPMLQAWLKTKPKEVNFIRIPVIFNENWVIFAKLYYAIEALADKNHIKNKQQLHGDFIEVVQTNPEIGHDLKALQAFFIQKKLLKKEEAPKVFLERLDSFNVTTDYQLAYMVNTIPTFVIQGKNKMYLTMALMAGSQENIFPVLNYLIAKDKLETKNLQNTNKNSEAVNS